VIHRLTGSEGSFFRPSGTDDGTAVPGADILAAAGEAGYPVVLGFDNDPYDYKDPGATTVTARVLADLHPGAIVSLHFGHPGTVDALPRILDGIDAAGFTAVRASTLLP
jgi:peptidoglycan/xylan/chitin deacetylase (PgdA/CDA1 family)